MAFIGDDSLKKFVAFSFMTSIMTPKIGNNTVFENQWKSLIQHCERSKLSLQIKKPKVGIFSLFWLVIEKLKLSVKQCYQKSHFEKDINSGKCQNTKNYPFWRVFENLKLRVKKCYQTYQFWYRQILMGNAKVQKFKCDILINFPTIWRSQFHFLTF